MRCGGGWGVGAAYQIASHPAVPGSNLLKTSKMYTDELWAPGCRLESEQDKAFDS